MVERKSVVTSEAHRQLIHRLFAEMDRVNLDALDEICAEDYTVSFPGVPSSLDRAGAKYLFGAFFAAFPGLTHQLDDLIVEGDKASVRLTIRGTHQAEFQGIPPTGKNVTIPALNMFRIAGGRIAEHWIQYDTLGFLQQLGVAPAPAGA
jgi:steroid delta-isomerase-like uncharacterized protein